MKTIKKAIMIFILMMVACMDVFSQEITQSTSIEGLTIDQIREAVYRFTSFAGVDSITYYRKFVGVDSITLNKKPVINVATFVDSLFYVDPFGNPADYRIPVLKRFPDLIMFSRYWDKICLAMDSLASSRKMSVSPQEYWDFLLNKRPDLIDSNFGGFKYMKETLDKLPSKTIFDLCNKRRILQQYLKVEIVPQYYYGKRSLLYLEKLGITPRYPLTPPL